MRIALLWMILTVFFITGCSSLTQPASQPTQQSWKNRETNLSQVKQWQLNGKIAIQTAQDSGSASINWQQNNQNYTISILGPLGSGGLTLRGAPGNVALETGDGKHYTANSPEQLLIQQWGWHLPVSQLRYWVRGLPVPGVAANSQFDQYHRLSSLRQSGTQVQYLSYAQFNGVELPQKIAISSPTIHTKIVIYEWNTNISH